MHHKKNRTCVDKYEQEHRNAEGGDLRVEVRSEPKNPQGSTGMLASSELLTVKPI